MELDDYMIDKIDKFIRGQLSEKDAIAFETEIAASKSLEEAVQLARLEMDAMEYFIEEDIREQITQWEKEPPPENTGNKKNRRSNRKWWFGFGALLLGLLIFYLIQKPGNKPPEPPPVKEQLPKIDRAEQAPVSPNQGAGSDTAKQDIAEIQNDKIDEVQSKPRNIDYIALAESTYAKPEFLSGLRSGEENPQKTALNKGIQAFIDEDYQTAVKELESIDPQNNATLYEAAKETLAHAYFKNRQFSKAATLFQSIVDESSFNKDEPEWYLLLSWIGDYAKNKKRADVLLERISNDKLHNHQRDAANLKTQLKALQN